MSYEANIAFGVAQAARNEAANLRHEVAKMRAQQERDEFKRWQNDTPDDEWIERRLNNVNKNLDALFALMSNQIADSKVLRRDVTRIEEAVYKISEVQTKQERRLVLLEVREKIQAWHRLLLGAKDNEHLVDIGKGVNDLMKLFKLLPDSAVLKGYAAIIETSPNIHVALIDTMRFLDENFSVFHSELAQVLEMNATKANPVALIKARQQDEALMKPYFDRVLDEPWRENLKKWMVAQIEQDIRIVQVYEFYRDTKLVNSLPKETHGELYTTVREIAKGHNDLRWIEFTPHALWELTCLFKTSMANPLTDYKKQEERLHAVFSTIFAKFTSDEYHNDKNEDLIYYSYIVDVLKVFDLFKSETALCRDMDYFCHLKRFLDNKQIDPANIPRLVDNLCIDRNFYTNLRMLEVSLDEKDPNNGEMAVYAKGLYRSFLSRMGDLCVDAGMTISLVPKTLDEERAQGCVSTYSPTLNPAQIGLSGTLLERALHRSPHLLSHINTDAWISVFNDRCIAARPLIDLSSLPATPEETLFILQKALEAQKADGTIPHFDLLPFTLQLNTLMTGLFNPWIDSDGVRHESTWKTMTGRDTVTVEQMLALQLNLVERKLYWSDGMEVMKNTADWHKKGRGSMDKNAAEDAVGFEGVITSVNDYKYEMDCTVREIQVQKTALTM